MNLYINAVPALAAGITEAGLGKIIKDVLGENPKFPINEEVRLRVMHVVLGAKGQIAERLAYHAREQILEMAKTDRFDKELMHAVNEWLADCGIPEAKEDE